MEIRQRHPQYKFGEWFVHKVGDLVGEARKEGKEMGLSEEQIRKVLLTAFETLGEQAGISVHQLNIRVSKKN